MLVDVTGRPRAGPRPGAQSGGSARPRLIPAPSSSASDSGRGEEGGSTPEMAAPRQAVRSPAATRVSGEPSAVHLAGDRPTERRRLPARVTRYWRWRAFWSALPFVGLLVTAAAVLPWGPWWVRWGVVAVVI